MLAVPPPGTGSGLVETMSTVEFLIVWPSIAAVRTLFGFFTMSWVTPGEAKRNSVGIARSSSGNLATAASKSEFGGGGLPIGKGMMLLSSIRGPEGTSNAVP